MRITIESTDKLVEIEGHVGGVPARIWEGTTAKGVPVIAFVTRLTPGPVTPAEHAEFEADLLETRRPSTLATRLPMRLTL